MSNLRASKLMPFIPAKDYQLSIQFYGNLGFIKGYQDQTLTEFSLDSCHFYLQNFYEKKLASNLVISLTVDDLNSWWHHVQTLNLNEKYPTAKFEAPQQKPWGQTILNMFDPSRVLWYITQSQ